MEKINFQDLPSELTPVNSVNLNRLQDNVETAIAIGGVSGDTMPVGSIVQWVSDTLPNNWLLCDGRAISRTEYPLLFNVIGTTYGAGDGSTTFNLPDLRGRVAVGKDTTQTEFDALGETGGEKKHTLTVAELPKHSPKIKYLGEHGTGLNDGPYGYKLSYSLGCDESLTTELIGNDEPHNILQPYQVTNYIIKAYQSAGIVATVVDGLNSISTTDALSANQGRLLGSNSTTNEIRIGTWINNKPIYRKTFEVGVLGENAKNRSFNYAGNYKLITGIKGFIYKSDGSSRTEFYDEDNSRLSFSAETDNNGSLTLWIYRGNQLFWADWNGSITVEYTKTTD